MSTVLKLLKGSKDPNDKNQFNRKLQYCGRRIYAIDGIRFCISRYYVGNIGVGKSNNLLVCRINGVDIIGTYCVSYTFVSHRGMFEYCLYRSIALLSGNTTEFGKTPLMGNNLQKVYETHAQDAFIGIYNDYHRDED